MGSRRTLTVCIAAVFGCVLLGSGFAQSRTESFNVTSGGRLETSVVGNIRVSSADTNRVVVRADGINAPDSLRITQTGNTVRVEYRPPRQKARSVGFDISVPPAFDLELATSGGNIEVGGLVTGTLHLTTSGGDIRIGDVNGSVQLNTSGGNIRTGNLSKEVEVTTSGGNIQLGNVGMSLRARTAGGNIQIGDVGGDATVTNSGGNISIQDVTGRASLSSSGGNIRLSAANNDVEAKTSGGNIELLKIMGSVQASTSGGNITVELTPGGTRNSVLTTPAGSIVLYVPTTAQTAIEAEIQSPGRDHDIRSDFRPEFYTKPIGGSVRAAFRLNGGGQRIRIETGSGNVEVRAFR